MNISSLRFGAQVIGLQSLPKAANHHFRTAQETLTTALTDKAIQNAHRSVQVIVRPALERAVYCHDLLLMNTLLKEEEKRLIQALMKGQSTKDLEPACRPQFVQSLHNDLATLKTKPTEQQNGFGITVQRDQKTVSVSHYSIEALQDPNKARQIVTDVLQAIFRIQPKPKGLEPDLQGDTVDLSDHPVSSLPFFDHSASLRTAVSTTG